MIPNLRLLTCIYLAVFMLVGDVAKADVQQDALDRIADFADRICSKIPLEGSSSQHQLSGEVKAELESILKYLADIGFEGAAELQSSNYKGLIQTDIMKALSNSTDCKREIWSDLKIKVLNKEYRNTYEDQHSSNSSNTGDSESKEAADLLVTALSSIKSGDCPLEIFSPYLTSLCVQQLENMMHAFRKRGSIKDLDFLGMQDSQYGLVEAYKVNFERGVMTWFVDMGPDGKLTWIIHRQAADMA